MSNPNDVSVKALQDQIAALTAQNAALAATVKAKISLKVSEKGALSVYGMGRFPVTLYAGQWTTLLDMSGQIREFIKANSAKLATKDKPVAKAA
jgi:hypothetical protein